MAYRVRSGKRISIPARPIMNPQRIRKSFLKTERYRNISFQMVLSTFSFISFCSSITYVHPFCDALYRHLLQVPNPLIESFLTDEGFMGSLLDNTAFIQYDDL